MGVARLDLAEHLVDGRERHCFHGAAELLERGLLGERPFRPEKRNAQARFQRQAGGHDLTEQPRHGFLGKRPLMARQHVAQDLGFPLRAVIIVAAFLLLGLGDRQRMPRAFADQRLNFHVQRIDLLAQFFYLRVGVTGFCLFDHVLR